MKAVKSQVLDVLNGKNENYKTAEHSSVITSLLFSDLPAQEKTLDRVQQEAMSIVGAGIETTRNTLTLATFHLLDNPTLLNRLRTELQTSYPDQAHSQTLTELEQLPFLTAVLQEGAYICLPQVFINQA